MMSTHLEALEEEVNSLNAEVTRLRLMVQQCVENESRYKALEEENAALKAAVAQQQAPGGSNKLVNPYLPGMPLPGQPLDVLPSMFTGTKGTARLFRLIMDTYPWLTPPEVREAQEIVKHEKELQTEERRLRHQRRAQRQQLLLQQEQEESMMEREEILAEQRSKMRALRDAAAKPLTTVSQAAPGNPTNPNSAGQQSPPQLSVPSLLGVEAQPTVDAGQDTKQSPPSQITIDTALPRSGSDAGLALGVKSSPGLPPAVPSTSGSTPKVQPLGVGGGVFIGVRPAAKKAAVGANVALKKKLAIGVASDDSDDDVAVNSQRAPTPTGSQTVREAEDDLDF